MNDRTVLLFFRDFESDRFVPGDRYLKRLVRPLYNRFNRKQKVTGFQMAFQLLAEALRRGGYEVRINDYRAARRNPGHPVGLFGYPHLLEGWDLPNPAVLGPGLYDHPSLAPGLMRDERNRFYLVCSEWMRSMFARHYGDSCVVWFNGIDAAEWPDTRGRAKDVDVLVYDKIRWNRETYEPALLHPVMQSLARRGLRVETLRYKLHDHAAYRGLLSRSRSMLFLCEHETQGLAYQEALASNVPVLAWDNGYWLDPHRPDFEPDPVPASSVPYFSPECGDRFRDFGEFDAAFERFWPRLDGYDPRAYVQRELSLERSAQLYTTYYGSLTQRHGGTEMK
ncbi:MAG TPA: hypothetical protein VF613_26145 [Longimicrobium sp.]